MFKPADIFNRKLKVMAEASRRWKEKTPAVARTTELLQKGGPKAASSPERVARFEAREYMKSIVRPFGIGFERKIGPTVDLDDTPTPTERKAGAAVARIIELMPNGRFGEGFATGFLVTPNLANDKLACFRAT